MTTEITNITNRQMKALISASNSSPFSSSYMLAVRGGLLGSIGSPHRVGGPDHAAENFNRFERYLTATQALVYRVKRIVRDAMLKEHAHHSSDLHARIKHMVSDSHAYESIPAVSPVNNCVNKPRYWASL